ncbi:MAG TPA: endonuclease, partial [Arthrobacter sp.]|nr:endonuclease [Arthrobacter sp.]
MEGNAAWSLEGMDAFGAVAGSVALLGRIGRGFTADGSNGDGFGGVGFVGDGSSGVGLVADPLRRRAVACLDGLVEVSRMEAKVAALKVRLAADY